MDKGVRADYIDRQFKAQDDDLKYQKSRMRPDKKKRFYESKSDYFMSERKKDLEEFRMVQESRPLNPPGKRL